MTDQQNWPSEIAKVVILQQQIEDVASPPLWERHFPRVAASERTLADTEAKLGFRLDPRYREFLSFADGWETFSQNVTLFGTLELVGGALHAIAEESLEILEDCGALKAIGVSRKDLLPIAASETQTDLFALCGPESDRPGHVLWIAGELIDDFPSFNYYFSAMVDYLIRDLDQFRAEAAQAVNDENG